MKIGCLQFNPRLGDVHGNIVRAETLLKDVHTVPELLVLPEMAFTGYNFPSREAIQDYLERRGEGPTSKWAIATAQRLKCHIIVGYPETTTEDGVTRNYNSTITVSPTGDIVNDYRKAYLYYTDETWAAEGPRGNALQHFQNYMPYFCGPLPSLHPTWTVGHGICMDINPYRFLAPWNAYEFANSMLYYKAHLVVLSMAWLTRLEPKDLRVEPDKPDMETVAYWLERFWPFTHFAPSEEVIVVFANRCGIEGNVVDRENGLSREDSQRLEHGEEMSHGLPPMGDQVCYAGSSCVMKFSRGSARMFERSEGEVAIMGKNEEGLLVVDTDSTARFLLQQKNS